jgi:hypothetical protein
MAMMHTGWVRIYLVATVLWPGWFGHELYDAHKQRAPALDFLATYQLDVAQNRTSAYNGVELGEWAGEQLARERFAFKALPVIPLGLPIAYLVVLWISRGFKKKP